MIVSFRKNMMNIKDTYQLDISCEDNEFSVFIVPNPCFDKYSFI